MLAQLVVHLTRKAAALFFLYLHHRSREPPVVGERVREIALECDTCREYGPRLTHPAPREPRERQCQKQQHARQFVERVPGGETSLRGILDSLINSEIRGVLSAVPLHAVLTEQRVPALPDVPTGREAGVPGFVMPLWYGMFAPPATPRDIINRLHRELVRTLEAPAVREQLAAQGVDPWPGTPEQLAELLRTDIERYGVIARSSGLKPQ